jgi:hypothetical protein
VYLIIGKNLAIQNAQRTAAASFFWVAKAKQKKIKQMA